jgi:hypothetical protein
LRLFYHVPPNYHNPVLCKSGSKAPSADSRRTALFYTVILSVAKHLHTVMLSTVKHLHASHPDTSPTKHPRLTRTVCNATTINRQPAPSGPAPLCVRQTGMREALCAAVLILNTAAAGRGRRRAKEKLVKMAPGDSQWGQGRARVPRRGIEQGARARSAGRKRAEEEVTEVSGCLTRAHRT